MKERPILFSAPMVQALLAGTKTQTRRAVKPQPERHPDGTWQAATRPAAGYNSESTMRQMLPLYCPYGQPGDRLWVRESLNYCSEYGHRYAADGTFLCSVFDDEEKKTGYSYECRMREGSVPSIHLPRCWSRITLEFTDVRVERLQDISQGDAIAEGITTVRTRAWDREHFPVWRYQFDEACAARVKPPVGPSPRESYQALWGQINGPGGWDANPWVWAVSFRLVAP